MFKDDDENGRPTTPKGRSTAFSAGSTSALSTSSRGLMTPKTPLSALSHVFQARPNYQKLRSAPSMGFETQEDKARLMQRTRGYEITFWKVLTITAILSSSLSFVIDQFTFAVGIYRSHFTTFTNVGGLIGVTAANVVIALIARLIVRTTMECEGSGFPEMKAMLFGHMLDNYLTIRVLLIKAIGLALLVGIGLPVGKEGPNCHMAACIARNLDSDFVRKRSMSATGQDQINKLLLAACAVGVGASFSAPIGGVIFSVELMLPQVSDPTSYWGCFAAAIIGSFVYEILRTWFAGATGLLPLLSTNILPGEGATTLFPFTRMLLDLILGAFLGYLGAYWVKMHAYIAKAFKDWRLSVHKKKPGATAGGQEPLLGEPKKESFPKRCVAAVWNFQWRDLFLVAMVTAINTVWAAKLPFLNGKPQPLLLSNLFDKNLLKTQEEWVRPELGLTGTFAMCAFMKWLTTILALSLSMPTGVVAPTMIIGGLIGRCYATFLPAWLVDTMIADEAGNVPGEDVRGAFLARFAIVGAAAFCAAVCRAFAMAITVFEVLALPNDGIPICAATLIAIFVANKFELPFFDKNLAGRNLGGIPALTFTDHANAPAFSIMKKLNVVQDCLCVHTRLYDMHELLKRHPRVDFFAVVRPLDDGEGVLVASMSRKNVDKVITLIDPSGGSPETRVDLLDPELQRPSDGSEPLVDGCPPHVTPAATVKEVYLIMKVQHGESTVYVTRDGCLLGEVTFTSLMTHEVKI